VNSKSTTACGRLWSEEKKCICRKKTLTVKCITHFGGLKDASHILLVTPTVCILNTHGFRANVHKQFQQLYSALLYPN